jgi:GT2 family glycosyltransferase
VRVDVAKKVRFNEKFFWSWESDFGYRLTKKGKMKYVPEAVVYHYHRSTWKSFFKQQLNNAKATPLLFLTKKKENIIGDHISTPEMGMTLLLAYISLGFLLISVLNTGFLKFSLISFTLLLLIFLKNSAKMAENINEGFWFLAIFFLRTIAWMIGLPLGIFKILK